MCGSSLFISNRTWLNWKFERRPTRIINDVAWLLCKKYLCKLVPLCLKDFWREDVVAVYNSVPVVTADDGEQFFH